MAGWGTTRQKAARAALAIIFLAALTSAEKRGNPVRENEVVRAPEPPTSRPNRAGNEPIQSGAAAISGSSPAFANNHATNASLTGVVPITVTPWRDAPSPQIPAYVDQLIDPNIGEDPALTISGGVGSAGLPGSATVEYRGFYDSTHGAITGSYDEQGVGLQIQQETDSLGRFDLRGAFTRARTDGFNSNDFNGGRSVNLAQRDFALTGTWLMNNEIGHIRARVPNMFWQTSYIRLPEPLIEGVSSDLGSNDASFRIASGTLGTYEGRTFPVFTTNFSSGRATGASGTFRFNPYWDASASAWQSTQATTTYDGAQDFTSVAGGLRYANRDSGNKAQASWLTNDNGRSGTWFDGETRFAGWIHDAGLYRMDPKLQWVDRNSPILMDTQGVYWRGATRSFSRNAGLGADWSQTNVNRDDATPTRTNSNVFGTLGSHLTPSFDLSGYLGIGQETVTGASTADTSSHTIAERATASTRHDSGTNTLMAGKTNRYGSNNYDRSDASWDYLWNPFASFSGLRVGVAYARQAGALNDFTQISTRAGGTWTYNTLSLSSNASYGHVSGGTVDSNVTSTFGLALAWQFAPKWQLSTDVTYNQNALVLVGPLNQSTETRISDTVAFVRLRYDASWGRAEGLIGSGGNKLGHGVVHGILFMDKNGNGIRDADEPGVANVTIYLDGGATIETNANGEFTFNRVASGEHHLQIDVANIPLPWVVSEEKPLVVNVEPRATERLDIPLVQPGVQAANNRS